MLAMLSEICKKKKVMLMSDQPNNRANLSINRTWLTQKSICMMFIRPFWDLLRKNWAWIFNEKWHSNIIYHSFRLIVSVTYRVGSDIGLISSQTNVNPISSLDCIVVKNEQFKVQGRSRLCWSQMWQILEWVHFHIVGRCTRPWDL